MVNILQQDSQTLTPALREQLSPADVVTVLVAGFPWLVASRIVFLHIQTVMAASLSSSRLPLTRGSPMFQCRARLTVFGRRLLVQRIVEGGWAVAHAAKAKGCRRETKVNETSSRNALASAHEPSSPLRAEGAL